MGEGGSAWVVEANQRGSRLPFVAKITDLSDRGCRRAFYNEVRILEHLHHLPRVIEMKSNFLDNDYEGVMILERMDWDLLTLILDDALSSPMRREIFRGVCEGVYSCHERNVAHLDVKPENVLCSKNGAQVKLIDFGNSQIMSEDGRVKQARGTDVYSAPEIVRGEEWADGRKADVWSLGVLFHTLYTGTWPYVMQCDTDLLVRIAAGELRLSHKLTEPQRAFLKLLLHSDPQQRPTLQEILSHPYLVTDSSSPAPPSRPRARKPFLRRLVALLPKKTQSH